MDEKPVRIEWLNQKQFCRLVGVNTRTAARWRASGYGPKAYKIGDYIKYKRLDALAWVDDQALEPDGRTAAEARADISDPEDEEG